MLCSVIAIGLHLGLHPAGFLVSVVVPHFPYLPRLVTDILFVLLVVLPLARAAKGPDVANSRAHGEVGRNGLTRLDREQGVRKTRTRDHK
ncbi:hypothetical protein B0I37DRAFT_364989 [Chaetomium sp. MPI-CAGE-AT-0009]|nr:hypothetical protein B0I37DRAFT_364989 [Chaetomium sp. MPI-CAGE-AT-0009]